MDAEQMQEIAERDQFWASLRVLRADIERIAQGGFDGSERDRQIAQLLARVTLAELHFRAEQSNPDSGST